jgi:Trk K+ transport system NAD-binding subunit
LHVQIIAIERDSNHDRPDINIMPSADDIIQADDILVLLGRNRDLDLIADLL